MAFKVNGIVKFAVFLVISTAAVAAVLQIPGLADLHSLEGMERLQVRVAGAVRTAGVLAPLMFVAVFSVWAVALPGIPFIAAGSILFGPLWGSILSIVSAHIAAAVSFLLGRYFLRDFARSVLTGSLEQIDRKAQSQGFRVVFLLRILSFPFAVVNYGVSASRIRFRDFLLGTFLGTSPYIVMISVFAGSFNGLIGSGELFSLSGKGTVVPAGILVATLIAYVVAGRFRRNMEARDATTTRDGAEGAGPATSNSPDQSH